MPPDDSERKDAHLLVAIVFLVVVGLCWYLSGPRIRARGLQLPPGPKGKWLTGNLHQLPRTEPWLTFTTWGNSYGPVVYFHVFGTETILLNSGKVALDLLESRSSIYSDRPKAWMLGELAGRVYTVFYTPFSDPRFKRLRRLLQTGLNPRASKSYRPIQTKEARVLLKGLLSTPEHFMTHIRRNSVAVILNVSYGYQAEEDNDPLVRVLEEGFKLSAPLAVPGKYLVEFMPFLRHLPDWFPGAGFKREAKKIGAEMSKIDTIPFNWAKGQIISGDFIDSFTSKYLLSEDGQKVDQDDLKWASAALYVGGGETVVSTMLSFFLLMTLHPAVQRQAQADIDRVAPDRLPTLADYDSLPYIRAILKEVLRWAPVAPLGLSHRVMEDDVYGNYIIPKGCKITANIWAITHDEDVYPDPYAFDPSRHLGPTPQSDPFKFVFGFGRRVCPGIHLAEMSLFLNIANVLSVYNISKALDENGVEVEPKIEWMTGATRHLKPFQCMIRPRSAEHALMVDKLE